MEPVTVNLKFKTGFAVSSGFGLAGILDNTIMRDARGLPYIPGTTIKGIIRQACEEIVLLRGYDLYDNVVDELKALKQEKKDMDDPKSFSPVTRIFGSPLIPSAFEFHSAYIKHSETWVSRLIDQAAVWAESHNSINPGTGTALKDHLFTHEVAMCTEGDHGIPCYTFQFSVIPLQTGIDDLISLLICGIRFADRLGAKKSRGKGVIDMEIQPPYRGDNLRNWIESTFQEGQ